MSDHRLSTPGSPTRSTRSLRPPQLGDGLNLSPLSPRRKKKVVYTDRFIPNRTGVDLQAAFSLTMDDFQTPPNPNRSAENDIEHRREEEANLNFNTVLKNELFGDNVPQTASLKTLTKPRPSTAGSGTSNENSQSGSSQNQRTPPRSPSRGMLGTPSSRDSQSLRTPKKANLFTYQSPSKGRPSHLDLQSQLYSLSPVRPDSQRFLLSPQKKQRNVLKVPVCCLDAPDLADDFYLNLVDWGSQDVLAVGLKSLVYLWNSLSGSVTTLCDLGDDVVTSLAWVGAGTHLAVGTQSGLVEIWDATTCKCTRTMTGHASRAASLAWNEHVLSSGSRDRSILHRDVRVPEHYIQRIQAHKQEVCGLKWNVEENKLALGSNDNRVLVWDGLNTTPIHKFEEHTAAVKAMAWSPHLRGILATGGGTADRRIKVWNTITGAKTQDIDTGSQVCNMLWLKNSNEIVLSHGFSKHQIAIWKYPTMEQVASLTGHSFRVLHLAMSPDGQTIVSGAGDETLRFWNVFDKNKSAHSNPSALLDAFMQLR
ncbi:hypothetical protein BABINDRAFT_161860 [Babjeviella inositovora NRRL Y-12698]|uniref:CDC20/Fizzy WD40 domain-containing protein n=1 Tax=Babjeviella inositovora NRRL Y-12698 TaxID=984486 RepID=A0A1E3QPR8_9ASCO|nr:uncharacterized protein BABINDRAFT_161860 [Babjeviella inositovora NRRL Y-12698]ODQ79464.1 hypothetical protein BABINDRAFT_161860 [Babjeviella inositovora NRRL Y-12698]